MAEHHCLPYLRLRADVLEYSISSAAYSGVPLYCTARIAYNPGNTRLLLDGEDYTNFCQFCLADNRPVRILEKDAGPVIQIHFVQGGLPRLMGIDGNQTGLGIKPAGHNAFPHMHELGEKIRDAGADPMDTTAAIDAFLLARLSDASPHGKASLFRYLGWRTEGSITVSAAADLMGISQRTLERECKRVFGRTPKRMLRGLRISTAIRGLELYSQPMPTWRDMEHAGLYADQSHFLRDAKALSGITPNKLHTMWEGQRTPLLFHDGEFSLCSVTGRDIGTPGEDLSDEQRDLWDDMASTFSSDIIAQGDALLAEWRGGSQP